MTVTVKREPSYAHGTAVFGKQNVGPKKGARISSLIFSGTVFISFLNEFFAV
jgi:hypothetical protein